MDIIADGQLYPEYPREAFLFYKLLKDIASPILDTLSAPPKGFFLKHVDDKGDHILVEDNIDITAIIDWQFARFVPSCEAFGPSLFTADLGALYGVGTSLGADDEQLATYLEEGALPVMRSELARRFQLGLASDMSRSDVVALTKAVLRLIGMEDEAEDVERWFKQSWDDAADDLRRRQVEDLITRLANERANGDVAGVMPTT